MSVHWKLISNLNINRGMNVNEINKRYLRLEQELTE